MNRMVSMNTLEHREYLLQYNPEKWLLGWWTSLLKQPPCLPPSARRSKQFSYEIKEDNSGLKPALMLHLVGFSSDLNGVEKNLVKFGIAWINRENKQLIRLYNDDVSLFSTSKRYDFIEYANENNFQLVHGKLEVLHSKYQELEDEF